MKTKDFFSLVVIIVLMSTGWGLSHAVVTTNIRSDGTLPTPTVVNPAGNVFSIDGGTIRGRNQFHSFDVFSLGFGDIASFNGANGVANILSRVTGLQSGLQPSLIYGAIQSNANLFFMNPAGIVFGPNATLNVNGMATFTTANYIRLTDNVQFNAIPNVAADALLSSADVAAFGFLGPNVADITLYGLNAQDPTQAVTFVGGNINLVSDPDTGALSTVTAPGRQINLTSVAGAGEVAAGTAPLADGMALGTITLDQGTVLSTAGDPSFGDGSGGAVIIRGGQFVSTGAQIITNSAFGSIGNGGAVTITVTDTASFTNNSTIYTSSASPNGDAGAISINASRMSLQDSVILAEYAGDGTTAGNGGAVTLTGTDSVVLARSAIVTDSFASNGNGGAVTIVAPTITLEDSLLFSGTFGGGSGGAVTLMGVPSVETSSISLTRSGIDTETSFTAGNSGSVTISAPTITIRGVSVLGTSIDTSTHSNNDPNAGNGGDVGITATNVTLSDGALIQSLADSEGTFSKAGAIRIAGLENILVANGTLLRTSTTSEANAGDMQLVGKHVTITGQSELLSETLGQGGGGRIKVTGTENISLESGSLISTNSANGVVDQGPAGFVELNTQQLSISGGSLLRSQTFGSGLGGTIVVNATEAQLTNGTISATSTGPGPAGNIQISAGDSLVMHNNSAITTATTQSDGGNINIQVGRLVQLDNSSISTSVQGGTGNGGNITIDPTFVILQGSQITANAFGGNGGNILIVANMFFADPLSLVSASSTLGVSGTINIQAPVTNLSGTLAPLSGEFTQAASLLRARCAVQVGGQFSSFVVAGRDGLPQEPGGLLPSPLFVQNSGGTRLAGALDLPKLQASRTFNESDFTLMALNAGCAS